MRANELEIDALQLRLEDRINFGFRFHVHKSACRRGGDSNGLSVQMRPIMASNRTTHCIHLRENLTNELQELLS